MLPNGVVEYSNNNVYLENASSMYYNTTTSIPYNQSEYQNYYLNNQNNDGMIYYQTQNEFYYNNNQQQFEQQNNYQNVNSFESYNLPSNDLDSSNSSNCTMSNSEEDLSESKTSLQILKNLGALNGTSKRKRKRVLNRTQRAEATQREKRRMLKLNKAFEELRKVLPISEFAKNKLSRAETLKSAIEYIERMSQLLTI